MSPTSSASTSSTRASPCAIPTCTPSLKPRRTAHSTAANSSTTSSPAAASKAPPTRSPARSSHQRACFFNLGITIPGHPPPPLDGLTVSKSEPLRDACSFPATRAVVDADCYNGYILGFLCLCIHHDPAKLAEWEAHCRNQPRDAYFKHYAETIDIYKKLLTDDEFKLAIDLCYT